LKLKGLNQVKYDFFSKNLCIALKIKKEKEKEKRSSVFQDAQVEKKTETAFWVDPTLLGPFCQIYK
jgi:hypothetical protein